jgi:hypothetical protein
MPDPTPSQPPSEGDSQDQNPQPTVTEADFWKKIDERIKAGVGGVLDEKLEKLKESFAGTGTSRNGKDNVFSIPKLFAELMGGPFKPGK